MARKRGGIAGIWDRNKKIIKPIATFTAGMVNPALGAAVGAAMSGLDREGKSGIGFDVKKGAIGGLQGYGMGKLGALAKGKAASLFTGSGGGGAASTIAGAPSVAPLSTNIASSVPELVTKVNPAAMFAPAAAPAGGSSVLGNVGQFLTKNQGLISGAGKAVAGVMGQQAERDQYGDQLALQRERFELEREEAMRERERRERVARLLMPLFDQQAAELTMRRG